MHAQQRFRETDSEVLFATIRPIGAMLLVTSSSDGLMSTFAPVLVEGDTDSSCPARATAIDTNSYVSPNWYPSKRSDPKVVPAWNHVHIQAHGHLKFLLGGRDDRDCAVLTLRAVLRRG